MPRFGWPRKKPGEISADEALVAEAEAIANGAATVPGPMVAGPVSLAL